MEQFLNVTQKLFQGFGENCIIFAVTLLAAIPLGLLVSFGSRSRFAPLRLLVKTVVWIIRGTPLMLQLFVVFYVTPLLFGGINTAPISNEVITLVKDTSLARVIAIPEILKQAENFSAQGLIWPLFYTGAFFLIFCGVLTLLFSYIEKKLDYYKG